jgi:hypothetical protein
MPAGGQKQPPAGSVLEPACPEMAGDTHRGLTSRTTTSEPDKRSWDFDGCESTSARKRNSQSPILTHETLPVSGASVVGMTIRVGQGQSHLPAGDFTVGSPSRRRRRNSSNGRFTKAAGPRQDQ